MDKAKIAYLLSFVPNPRFNKRINATKDDFDVHVICWAKTEDFSYKNTRDLASFSAVHIEANAYDPVERIKPYKEFFGMAVKRLRAIRPALIHLQGLDMLLIACWYKFRYDSDVRIVYEVADLHRLLVDEQVGAKRKVISRAVKFFESFCAKRVDRLIVTSEKYFEACYFAYYSPEKVLYIPNAPFRSLFEDFQPKNHSGRFVVGFIGGIRYIDEMKMLLSAAEKAGVDVFLAGAEKGDEIRRECCGKDNVDYFGPYDYDTQISMLYGKCDAVYSVYPANMKNVKVALPNKLYESIICGLPLIVAKDTYVGELVDEWGVGLSVNYNDEEALAEVLRELASFGPLYERLSCNAANKAPEVELDRYLENYVGELRRLCDKTSN